jgi:hypothetical protein
MCAVFHQFTPAELYIGITEPANTVAENSTETHFTGFHATGYPFLDIFLSNLHQYGMRTADFHSARMDLTKPEFCFTLQTRVCAKTTYSLVLLCFFIPYNFKQTSYQGFFISVCFPSSYYSKAYIAFK